MKYVWLLWGSDTETPWIEGVYTSKVQAEADLRILEDAEECGYIYWIQEKQVTTLELKESKMPMKTSELTGDALDWAVAKCEGVLMRWERSTHDEAPLEYSPSTDWAQGGPIIEREGISLFRHEAPPALNCGEYYWKANNTHGPTPLIAAMRGYVTSKLGDEIKLPEELS
jgi:hypothetical protein